LTAVQFCAAAASPPVPGTGVTGSSATHLSEPPKSSFLNPSTHPVTRLDDLSVQVTGDAALATGLHGKHPWTTSCCSLWSIASGHDTLGIPCQPSLQTTPPLLIISWNAAAVRMRPSSIVGHTDGWPTYLKPALSCTDRSSGSEHFTSDADSAPDALETPDTSRI
jgi:hypothetical protein